jgi:carbamoyltransferase
MTRTRRAALQTGQLPGETIDAALLAAGRARADISAYAVAETGIELPTDLPVERVDHHFAHAATSFYTSPFSDAVILVCDRRGVPDLTIWLGDEAGVRAGDFPWAGPGFAAVYSLVTGALGFAPGDSEYRVEALARIARRCSPPLLPPIRHRGDHLEIPQQLRAAVASHLASNGQSSLAHAADLANDLQRRLGDLLLETVGQVKRLFGGHNLCLGGGLFYNSYFTSLLAQSGLYEHTFVPVNPGNAGAALGAALAVARPSVTRGGRAPLSPFLGPGYGSHEVKAVLDNCKLSYDYMRDGQIIERTAEELAAGKLVGWFQGRMEWGPRALGNRSILASPSAPYVLDNLNHFLKQREPYRSYGVSVCAEDVGRYFHGPTMSDFMEYEYDVADRDVLHALLPSGASKLRVQTVPESAGVFYNLLRAFGDLTGMPMLVNTSFNGFNEPIVCTPRDAVRVFYGTGLDMAVINSFVLLK